MPCVASVSARLASSMKALRTLSKVRSVRRSHACVCENAGTISEFSPPRSMCVCRDVVYQHSPHVPRTTKVLKSIHRSPSPHLRNGHSATKGSHRCCRTGTRHGGQTARSGTASLPTARSSVRCTGSTYWGSPAPWRPSTTGACVFM